MKDLQIELPPGTALKQNVIEHCVWRIESYVTNEAYAGYDYVSGYQNTEKDRVTTDLVRAMNTYMLARSSYAAWKSLEGQEFPELRSIPGDLDLIDSSDVEVQYGWQALGAITRRIAAVPRLTDMAASKVLHLLRPRFVAISDSYLRGCLGIPEQTFLGDQDKATACAGRLLSVQKGMRELARNNPRNQVALDQVYGYFADHAPITVKANPCAGKSIPVRLSKLRILDILLWSQGTLFGPNPSARWNTWYQKAGFA